ncbi:hypothetical protein RHMOL_Rhmol07G0276200 [Rhododendron molle]|uniref:Uncharacterized protein n=1 Tax=Rhododendron molle TaxID=49168 RepID=A0ACC0N751_RHOML|nr:hypothetical protein RHMOL_Rhmol07G0276200 [Rhododendron molle]
MKARRFAPPFVVAVLHPLRQTISGVDQQSPSVCILVAVETHRFIVIAVETNRCKMTNPKRTGKELVPVVYATEARPLAMIDPPKEMRQKKSPRKRTSNPVVINIDESAEKNEVVKSSSPSPRKKVSEMKRKGSHEADVAATVQTSSRTQIKKNTKRPETKMVYEKKRKRPNREDEEVIDLNTPTKRVTRSSEALKKMQRDKDMEETEDKGIKRKTRHQVSKGGCSNRTPDVNQKLKGDEEEEEWDEDEGDEEETRKGKKGQEGKGVKGKRVQPKKEKVQPERKVQYR